MKNRLKLKIFYLTHPLLHTEWLTLQGDKYLGALNFDLEIVEDVENAQVVVWDGIITPKNSFYVAPIIENMNESKVLLLQGEIATLYKNHPIVKLINLNKIKYVELPGLCALPEDLLSALDQCHQKLQPHV